MLAAIRLPSLSDLSVSDRCHESCVSLLKDSALREGSGKSCKRLFFSQGYSAQDVIQTLSRVTRSMDMPEKTKLDFLQVLGTVHMRILDGTDSLLQLSGCAPTLRCCFAVVLFCQRHSSTRGQRRVAPRRRAAA